MLRILLIALLACGCTATTTITVNAPPKPKGPPDAQTLHDWLWEEPWIEPRD